MVRANCPRGRALTDAHHRWRPIVSDVVAFATAFGLTNVVSYLYIVLAGRMLLPEQFGVLNALVGAIAISGFLAASLQLAITEATTLHPTRPALATFMRSAWRIAFPAIPILTLASMPFAAAIEASAVEVMLCGLAMLLMVLACAPLGFLAGVGRVRAQAGVNLVGALVRLGVGWPLIAIGTGVAGGVLGYLAGYVTVFGLAYAEGKYREGDSEAPDQGGTPSPRFQPSSIATFVLAFAPLSLDQLLVQAFAPSLGGPYAGVTTIAKLVFYGAYPVMAVVYPQLLRRSNERSRARLALASAGAVIVIALTIACVLAAFSREFTEILFADRYHEAVPHVGTMAFGVACFSLSAIGAHVLVAWGDRIGSLPSLVAVAAGITLFAFRHDSLGVVVSNLVWTYAVQLILISTVVVVTITRSPKGGHRTTSSTTSR